jgi:hypothetical protein
MKLKRKESVEEEAINDYWRASELLRAERTYELRRSMKLGDPALLLVNEDRSEEFLGKVLGPNYDGGSSSNLD